jgi:arylsulfatase A-like enzyme/Flp pilus assembly protein TadD
MIRAGRLAVVALAVAPALAACGSRPAPALPKPAELRGANVLLVTIDTLRQDRVGAYGNASGLTPTLDRLAAAGVRYAHAYSHVPMTLPAHTSILTGLTPLHHGVRNNTAFRLDHAVPTLAERMKAAGYRTGAFVGAFVLDARFGLARGFDEYDDRLPHADRTSFNVVERRAEDVLNRAERWILESRPDSHAPGGPWFAWVHLFDPHAPYDAPPAYRTGRSPYDAEIAYADAMLGRFLDHLRAAGALDRTLIVVTADHGESLGEHGEQTHGLFAYQSTIAVPLIVSGPAVHAGVVDAPVGHADIAPTVLDLVGGTPPDHLDGQSLVQPPPPDRPLYVEALDAYLTRGWAPLQAVVRSGWKFIDLPDPELYDLGTDPAEQHNLPGSDSHQAPLAHLLRQWRNTPTASSGATLDGETAGRLQSLGYVSASVTHRGAFTSRDDPKHLVALSERFNSALTAFDEGRPAEALDGFAAVLRERPDFLSARTSAATVLMAIGRAPEAARLLREAPADQAGTPEVLSKLGAALRESGDLSGAATSLEQARRARPDDAGIVEDLGVVYATLGRVADARAAFQEALAMHPHAATVWYNLGIMELQNRQAGAAANALHRAVENDPEYADAWRALGFALVGGNRAAAADAWRRAERLAPGDYDLLFNLAMVLAESDEPADAVPYLQRFLREAPPRYTPDRARVEATLARIERTRR